MYDACLRFLAQDVSSRVGCLPAPDDYSKQVRAWFLTSECHVNTEATRTTLLGTFRTTSADLKVGEDPVTLAPVSRAIVKK
ncbi:hypothetical protein PIB30_084457, partial [Stylosanthes scabra]|nr:hypothetical protein [Stylosanthes scabra]